MHHFITLVRPLPEELHVFRRVDGRGLRQDLFLVVNGVNLIRNQIHPVAVGFIPEDNMERKIMHLITLDQFRAKIAGAVRTENDFICQTITSL